LSLRFLDVAGARAADLPWPDVYFSPEYGAALEVSDGAEWEVAVYEPGPILLPYLKRPIDDELASAAGEEELYDLVGPYGYAGAWAPEGTSAADWRGFRQAFRTAARERGLVAEFLRLTALVPGADELSDADDGVEVARISETFCLDLTGGEDVYWKRAEGRHRTSTRKALKVGLRVLVEPLRPLDLAPGSPFRERYEDTMRRVEAKAYYLFADAYYDRLHEGLVDRTWLGRVLDGDRVVAAALFFRWDDLLHYHLAGSERRAARDGANNLLLDAAVRRGIGEGARRFHLGGGLSEGDALHRFKRSLGGAPLPFRVARCVLDPERYERLCSARARLTDRSRDDLARSGWFPAYRA
jgi:hypothetical protein